MEIRHLDPAANPADHAAIYPAFQQWHRYYLPGLPEPGEARLRHWSTSGYRAKRVVLGAFADEQSTEAVGFAVIYYQLTTNLDLTGADLMVPAGEHAVAAETALLEELERRTADLGRKRMAVMMPGIAAPPFAERRGGRHTDTAIMSTLDLAAIDRAQYETWAEPSAKNDQYTLVGWIGGCPDELAESFCRAMDAMADQPLGTFEYEFEKNDLDRLRFNDAHIEKFGIRRYTQVALDPDGDVAGFNTLAAYPDEPGFMEIWDTGVPRKHRGHGLGLRLKAAASLWVLEDRPSTRLVSTFNNDENQWMLAVNRRMGYRPLVDWPGYEFTIAG